MNFKSLIAELCISAGGRDVQDITVWNQKFGSFKSEFFICYVLVSGWIQTDKVLTFLFLCEWIKAVKVKLQSNSGLPPTLPLDWCRREETVTCWFFEAVVGLVFGKVKQSERWRAQRASCWTTCSAFIQNKPQIFFSTRLWSLCLILIRLLLISQHSVSQWTRYTRGKWLDMFWSWRENQTWRFVCRL